MLAALLGAAVLVGLLIPREIWTRLPDLCPFHRIFGRPCPTCGLTRSWAALLHGDMGAAFRFHLLGPVLLAGLAGFLAIQFRGARPRMLRRGWAWGLGLVWVSYALVRMAGWLPSPPVG